MAGEEKRVMRARITYVEFFRLCEFLRNNREEVEKSATDWHWLTEFCQKNFGKIIGHETMKQAVQETGLKLPLKRATPTRKELDERRVEDTREITRALLALYRKLGETPPEPLVKLVEWCEGKPMAPIIASVPVKDVRDPKTISVVNAGANHK